MPLPDRFEIDDVETLKLFGDPTRLEVLELLMLPRTVTELAEALDVPRTRLYHHINLLTDHGLVRVVEERRVGALTERVYQVSAKSFTPSKRFLAEAEPREQAEAVVAAVLQSAAADFVRAVAEGRVSLDQRGPGRTLSVGRRLMRLRPQRLGELIEELEGILEKYDEAGDDEDGIVVGAVTLVHPSSRSIPHERA